MWSAQEMKYHINILDLLAVKLTIQTLTRCQSNTSSSRQYCGFNILDENGLRGGGGGAGGGGGYSKSQNGRVGQGNLGISFEVWDHNYCRIPSKRIECSSRLEISKQPTLHGNQILTVMQQMHFNRIGHTNSCMSFPHFA